MNCKQIREAIDTASRRAPYGDAVSSHLSGCLDCRRHADETNSLLTLLSAQPRVQAPADFDFRLRARIARAQAETASPAGLLERLWENFLAQTFSWGQAATAMAAVAMVVTVSTLYINHNGSAPVTIGDVAVNQTVDMSPGKEGLAAEFKPSVVETSQPAVVKATNKSVRTMPVALKPEAAASTPASTPAPTNDIASVAAMATAADGSPRFYSRETRQFVPDRPLIGAELVSINTAKSAVTALTF